MEEGAGKMDSTPLDESSQPVVGIEQAAQVAPFCPLPNSEAAAQTGTAWTMGFRVIKGEETNSAPC